MRGQQLKSHEKQLMKGQKLEMAKNVYSGAPWNSSGPTWPSWLTLLILSLPYSELSVD